MIGAARRYVAAGLSVVPIRTDGSKAPAWPRWRELERRRPTEGELAEMFEGRSVGIAIIGGDASGGLEVLDFDKPGVFEAWLAELESRPGGLLPIVQGLPQIVTPASGRHVYYRCVEIEGNQKLARAAEPFTDCTGKEKTVLVETRGRGGYVLAPPSPPECHPAGWPYMHSGGPELPEVPRIRVEERAALLEAARALDEQPARPAPPPATRPREGGTVGEEFNRRSNWDAVLLPHRWTRLGTRGDTTYWRRPGKSRGTSATTGGDGDWLYVFSTSVPELEVGHYDRFGAFVRLEHGGDFRAAARALVAAGYGAQERPAGDAGESPPAAQNGGQQAVGGSAAGGGGGAAAAGGADDWRDRLLRSQRRSLLRCTANAITILAHDERWGAVLAWDEFSQTVVGTKPPPWDSDDAPPAAGPGEWTDADFVRCQAWLARRWRLAVGRETVYDAARVVAERRPYHPVREYLEGLEWDAELRLDSWLSRYLGAAAGPYTAAVGRLFLVSAVARVFRPGCKVDTMIVLEGPQGGLKSTALRLLFGDAWFSDTPFELESKDRFVALRGRWCLELAELDSLRRADVNRIKSFLSSPADSYRPPYGRGLVTAPRQCVFAGTTNQGEYLRDESGNRRFWPVRCGRLDLEGLSGVRDMLWAEARARFESGEQWWPGADEGQLFAEEQAERLNVDAWQPVVDNWLARRIPHTTVTVGDVLDEAIGVNRDRWDQQAQNRAARCLRVAGWVRRQRREAGRRTWVYMRPEDEGVTSVTSSAPVRPVRLVTERPQ